MKTLPVDNSDRSRCPECGQENHCGFDGRTPCWCAAPELERLKPQAGAGGCYCRACLDRLLARQRSPAT